MKRFVFAAAFALVSIPCVALADPPAPAAAPVIKVEITARPPRPQVVVLLQHPAATEIAGEAHDRMRAVWLERSVPAAMKGK